MFTMHLNKTANNLYSEQYIWQRMITNNRTYLLILVAEYLTIGECYSSLIFVSKYHLKFLTYGSNLIILKRMIKNEFGDNSLIENFNNYKLFEYFYDGIWKLKCNSFGTFFKRTKIFDHNWNLNAWKFFTEKLSKYHRISASQLGFKKYKGEYAIIANPRNSFDTMYMVSNFIVSGYCERDEGLIQKVIEFILWLQKKHEWGEEQMYLWRNDFPKILTRSDLSNSEKIEGMSDPELEYMCSVFFQLMSIAYDDEFMNFELTADMDASEKEERFLLEIESLVHTMHWINSKLKNEMFFSKWMKHFKIFIIHFNSEWIVEVFNNWLSFYPEDYIYHALFIIQNKTNVKLQNESHACGCVCL